jgi:hypothetical protein
MEPTLTWGGAEFDKVNWPNVYAVVEELDAARLKQEGGMFGSEARAEARDGESDE